MSAPLWQAVTWDVARAGGLVAYLLLTLSVALGLALSLRWQRPRWPRLITNELHSFVTLLALVFTGVHGVAVWADPFTHFGWRDVLVPLATWYRPLWMAAGIVGLYLMLAVWVSTQLRPRISYTWRLLHTLIFAVYLLSTLHDLGGRDGHPAAAGPPALRGPGHRNQHTVAVITLLVFCHRKVILLSQCGHGHLVRWRWSDERLGGERGDSDMAVMMALPRGLGRTAGRMTRHGHTIRGPPASAAAIGPRRAH